MAAIRRHSERAAARPRQGVGLLRLVQLEPVPVITAIELEGPTWVLEARLAARRLQRRRAMRIRHNDPMLLWSLLWSAPQGEFTRGSNRDPAPMRAPGLKRDLEPGLELSLRRP